MSLSHGRKRGQRLAYIHTYQRSNDGYPLHDYKQNYVFLKI